MERFQVKVYILGIMETIIMGNGKMVLNKGMVNGRIIKEIAILVNGLKIW